MPNEHNIGWNRNGCPAVRGFRSERRTPMQVAIIGSGNVGTALATALRRTGHHVVFGLRAPDPGKPDEATIPDAARRAEAVLPAIPFDPARDAIPAARGAPGT